jgi:hypothetical protein
LIGVDFVSGSLFDGRTDHSRIQILRLDDEGALELYFPPVEDLIADRLGQYESVPQGDQQMLEQAKLLWQLGDDIDTDYLHKRVAEECSSVKLLDLLT